MRRDIAVIISYHKRTTFGWTQESGDQLIEMRLLGGMFGTNANLRNAAKYPTTLGENFRSDFLKAECCGNRNASKFD